MKISTILVLLSLVVLALGGCRTNVRDPACLAIYDGCMETCEGLVLAPSMPDQTALSQSGRCTTDCTARARSCQSQVNEGKKPGELK